jgi:hypothetical protein
MTHITQYETRDGKTYRVKDPAPANPETAETAAAPNPNDADHNHAPDTPAKKGA